MSQSLRSLPFPHIQSHLFALLFNVPYVSSDPLHFQLLALSQHSKFLMCFPQILSQKSCLVMNQLRPQISHRSSSWCLSWLWVALLHQSRELESCLYLMGVESACPCITCPLVSSQRYAVRWTGVSKLPIKCKCVHLVQSCHLVKVPSILTVISGLRLDRWPVLQLSQVPTTPVGISLPWCATEMLVGCFKYILALIERPHDARIRANYQHKKTGIAIDGWRYEWTCWVADCCMHSFS